MSLLQVALPIALAVLKVAAIAAAGWVLAKRRLLHESAVADISELIIKAFAPCLIFANAASTSALNAVSGIGGIALIAAGPALLAAGYVLSAVLARLFRVDRSYRTAVVATATFQNQLYLPLAVGVAVVPSVLPALLGHGIGSAAAIGGYVVALSVFSIGYSPFFWGVALAWITSDGNKRLFENPASLAKLIPAPVIGLIAGFVVALTPLHGLMAPPHAPLRFLLDATSDLGSVTVPLANLVLGAMLARAGIGAGEPLRNLTIAIGIRLAAVPALCMLALYASRSWWRHSPDLTMVALVVFIEAMSPPATNLAVMAKRAPDFVSGHENRTAEAVPRILLIAYILAVLVLPLWLMIFVRLAATW